MASSTAITDVERVLYWIRLIPESRSDSIYTSVRFLISDMNVTGAPIIRIALVKTVSSGKTISCSRNSSYFSAAARCSRAYAAMPSRIAMKQLIITWR